MAANSVLLYRFEVLKEASVDQMIHLLENNVLEDTKVVVDEYDDKEFSGFYIYSEIYKTREYNFETNVVETVSRKRYNIVEFHFDIESQMMDIWGNSNTANHFIAEVAFAFDNQCIIEPCELDFSKIIEYLSNQDNVFVGKITAKQVAFENELLADCTFDLSKKERPFEIIIQYIDNVQKIGFKWKWVNTSIGMTVFKSGAITIYRERNHIDNEELKCIYDMLSCVRRNR